MERGVKAFGIDCQALDHPMGTALGPQPNGPIFPNLVDEYAEFTGRAALDDFPEWEPCHRQLLGNGIVGFENVGGQIDEVTGNRSRSPPSPGAGQAGRLHRTLVAILDPTGEYRLESGNGD